MGKHLLLDELQTLTGHHRKSLLRRLNQQPDQQQNSLRGQTPAPFQPRGG
ncbi:hypothetical protein KBY57_06200 [Cyanobium sp. Aljojuca 7D2]|nr:hypothetical protein [Cyanobium sp. Aljojuca 7D2]MCP9890649.1 hypothetical protein [Cyanobium sp. Aljojuca 7D2]